MNDQERNWQSVSTATEDQRKAEMIEQVKTALPKRLKEAGFRLFDDCDWDAYCGCESDVPLINDIQDDIVVLLDGTNVQVEYDHLIYSRDVQTRELAEDLALLALACPETRNERRFELIFGDAIGGV